MDFSGEKVALITATWDSVKAEAYFDHMRLVACMASRLPPEKFYMNYEPRQPTALACTSAFSKAIDAGCDWMLWIDDDVCPPFDAYFRLREGADVDARPIVSALAFFRGKPYWPSIFKYEGWGDRVSIARPMPVVEWPENQCVRVDATGLPCTLIHRSVFEKIGRPWFKWDDEYTSDGWFMSRVALAGIPVYCHTGVIADHLVTSRVNDKVYRAWSRQNGGIEEVRRMAVQRFRLDGMKPVDESKLVVEPPPFRGPELTPCQTSF